MISSDYNEDEVIADSEGEMDTEVKREPRLQAAEPVREASYTILPTPIHDSLIIEPSTISVSTKPSSISSFTTPGLPPHSVPDASLITSSASAGNPEIASDLRAGDIAIIPQRAYKMPRPKSRKSAVEIDPTPESPIITSSNARPLPPLSSVIMNTMLAKASKVSASSAPTEPITISSDDVEPMTVNPTSKKRKIEKMEPIQVLDSPPIAPKLKKKAKPKRIESDGEGGDDPMLLKPPNIQREGAWVEPPISTGNPSVGVPLVIEQGDDSDFKPDEPSEAKKVKKVKKPKKIFDGAGAHDNVKPGDAPSGKKRSKKKKEEEATIYKSKEFIDDSDADDSPTAIPGASRPTLPLLDASAEKQPDKKRRRTGGGDRKSKKRKIPDDDDQDVDNLDGHPTFPERSSTRVALAKSLEPIVDEPSVAIPSVAESPGPNVDKPKKKRKIARKVDDKSDGNADESLPPGAPCESPAAARPGGQGKVEVVIPVRHPKTQSPKPATPDSPAAAIDSVPAADPDPARAPSPSRSKDGPPIPKAQSSTPVASSSADTSKLVPYWRRPNKPLSDLLNQSTPGSQARPSGLRKTIQIAPLHMNRKPPPPPLPPIPRKKTNTTKGDGEGSDEDDETPKARMKRLAAEFESLEGMDSKKANDRRKEINEEMERLMA